MAAIPGDGARLTVALDVVSDICCPWCFLGKRRLGAAIATLPEIDVLVAWRPYQLDPDIPREGIDRREYFRRKFGDADEVERMHEHLKKLGAMVGIPYAFERIKKSVNSFDAHRLVRWAQETGRQDRVLERLFAAFWIEGRDISNSTELATIAAEAGLDGDEIARRLADDCDVAAVTADIRHATEIGVKGVPTFILARKYAVSGAEEPEALAKAIRQIAGEVAKGPVE